MGKTYIDTVKYVVKGNITIDGIVEKPDVVGAVFGQTEGLLGEELDLRELQKSGRIGRIEVNILPKAGKSEGEIILPSSLDKVETAILAAALETVDRVGPCEAHIKVSGIEDTRTLKRDQVVEKAKFMLKTMIQDKLPESKEISELVRDEVKLAEAQTYGTEKLTSGPNIDEAEHIILVEGRADVLTMLKADIKNVIALQGKVIPKTVMELTKRKTATVFVDGDRGGDLIIRQLADCAEVDFVAKAPDGKEVEELTKKEIIKCLRNKLPFEQFMSKTFKGYVPVKKPEDTTQHAKPVYEQQYAKPAYETQPYAKPAYEAQPYAKPAYEQQPERTPARTAEETAPYSRPTYERREWTDRRTTRYPERMTVRIPKVIPRQEAQPLENPFAEKMQALEGSLKAALLDKDKNPVSEVDVKDLLTEMDAKQGVETIVFDGIITQHLVDTAKKYGIKNIAGVKKSRIEDAGGINIYSK